MERYPTDERFDLAESTVPAADHGVRIRIGLGAAVVLVLVAAGIAILISAVSSHPAAATITNAAAAGAGVSSAGHSAASAVPAASDSQDVSGAARNALVQVVGQVKKPGLYELPAGDRVLDAVAAAGGFTTKADQASLNLAQVIADGEQIVVAKHGSISSVGSSAVAAGSSGVAAGAPVVDINTADLTALETLDGIGPALAQRILTYRTAHNGFRSVGDLQNVTGIGPKKYAAIKASVSV